MFYLKLSYTVLPKVIMAHRFVPEGHYDTGFRSLFFLELVMVEQGAWVVETEGLGCFTALPGDIFMLSPLRASRCQTSSDDPRSISCSIALIGDFHGEILDEDACDALIVREEALNPPHQDNPYFLLPFLWTAQIPDKTEKEINTIIQVFNQPDISQPYTLNALVMLLMADLSAACVARSRSRQIKSRQTIRAHHVKKIISYLEKYYAEPLDLAKIACDLNLHPNYVCNMFKKATQQTLTDYLNHIRIQRAKQLLIGSSYPIKRISGLVGITNEQYFGKLFKKREGITPGQYRAYGPEP